MPAIRTVQGDLESDVIMDELHASFAHSDRPSSEEEEDDEEVDQLLSTEDESMAPVGTSASVAGASKPKARPQKTAKEKSGERSAAGQPPVPIARLHSILESEVSDAMSKEAMFVLSAATDAFIKRLAESGHRNASLMRRSTVTYHDMASAIQQHSEFVFLEETIPQPLGLAEALRLRKAKEKEFLEPLLSTPAPPHPISLSVPVSQSLSITLPPARSISVAGSGSLSNAPSPKPPASINASASTSKSTATKGKRKTKQSNGESNATISALVNGGSTASSAAVLAGTTSAAESASVNMAAPVTQPRRMSMREPKPRRRPDGQEDPLRPLPVPPTSPVKESASAIDKAKSMSATATSGKTRPSRAKTAKSKAKAEASSVPSLNTPDALAQYGANHAHTNGNGVMVTRSRRGSTAVVLSSAPSTELELQPDEYTESSPELSSGIATGFASGVLDGPGVGGAFGRSGLTENPGRTIYSPHRLPNVSATR